MKMKMTTVVAAVAALAMVVLVVGQAVEDPCFVPTMDGFEVPPYMGKWYTQGNARLARISFERNLECEHAVYTLKDVVLVNNTGRVGCPDANCPVKEADGFAKQTDPTERPGALEVTFSGDFTGVPNYFVVDTDYTSYTVVGGTCRTFLWILGRTNMMDDTTYDYCVEQAVLAGFDLKAIGFERKNNTNCVDY
mmetsp:Transcript_20164/g.56723  ORF Transcript_20164/g.56723 Transcript_20164/m.56723 type:complete len:193 (+) Transcript_20164:17-595(+)